MNDVIVIGAGPAGLQAALTLGRMHRSVVLLDSGEYRNAGVRHMHNMIGNDGRDPGDLRAAARRELTAYPTVSIRDIAASEVTGSAGDFAVRLADGSDIHARHVLLATGIADDLPPVPGLAEAWTVTAFTCPFCDGHEFAGQNIAILGGGPRAAHLIGLLTPIVGGITVLPVGASLSADDHTALDATGAHLSELPATAIARTSAGVRITTEDDEFTVAGIFVAATTSRQRAPFAEELGLSIHASGAISTDDFGRTSAPGVWAAGDLAHRASLPGPMASVLAAASAGQTAAAMIVAELAAQRPA